MLHKEALKSRRSREAFRHLEPWCRGPRLRNPRPGIAAQIPHSTIRTDLLLLVKIRTMSPTVVRQTTINVRLGTSNIFLEFTWLGCPSEAHPSSAEADPRTSDPGVTHLP